MSIPHLSNLSNIRSLGRRSPTGRKAYSFDGVNDYIAGDTTIGRTGYDLTVAGNVSTGSDADGSYFYFDGNRDATAATGTSATIGALVHPSYNQGTSFTLKCRFKINSYPANNTSGIFGFKFAAVIYHDTTSGKLNFGLRGSSTVANGYTSAYTTGQLVDAYLVYDHTTSKFYCYIGLSGAASTLLNVGGTSGPATFSTSETGIGDFAYLSSNESSSSKYIYHAAIRNVALTQAEIDADIALGNTAKSDSRIVAYYIPENLQYNTQYMTNPKALDQSNWVKTGATAVTANTTVAPDGTTTADQVAISGTATQGVSGPSTAITGSVLASKTLIVKAFVKVAAGTAAFRLGIGHTGVADYYSSNQTATTVWQEFTFTQTLTSSTAGTGFSGGVFNDSTATNPTLEVRNVRVFLTNETLRDESPNIGGYIGWKTPVVMSARVKPDIDSADTTTKQVFLQVPRHYLQLRTTNNSAQFRSETTLRARVAAAKSLGNGFRGRVHVLGYKVRDGTGRLYKSYVNGQVVAGSQTAYSDTVRPAVTIYRTNASAGFYATDYRDGLIRDPRIYTFTGSFTDADALAIYNGLEPTSAGVTKYLQRRPTPGETGTTAIDHSGNSRTGTLTGGTTRVRLSGS